MDQSTVATIAREIVENQFLFNWKYYLVLVVVMFLVVAATNFFSAYFKGRGSSFATKADFDELLNQLRKTTETTESIKRTISHEDWSIREFKTIRRAKLEELMVALYEAHHWLEKERGSSLFAENGNETPDPMYRVNIIAGLYFPELKAEILVFQSAFLAYQSWLVESKGLLLPLKLTDPAKYTATLPSVVANFPNVYQPLLTATTAVEDSARKIMREILGVDF